MSMNELEYVLSGFEQKLSVLKGKRLLVHGSREYAREIIDRFKDRFSFEGVMSDDAIEGDDFHGLPVYQEEDFNRLAIDAVLLTERVKYAESVYRSICDACIASGISIYNMYGLDEIRAHQDIESSVPQSLLAWKRICAEYDVVGFEAMDVFLVQDKRSTPLDSDSEYVPRNSFRSLAVWLLGRGVDVQFSLRKSFPEEKQLAALRKAQLCTDLENRIIHRSGEDLSFRRFREAKAGKKILYIGMGLINECLLPRCYGIDTMRYVPPREGQAWYSPDWYMPVGNKLGDRIPFDAARKDRIKSSIAESSVVSFDVFDTLLLRRTLVPEDVFRLVERKGKARGLELEGFSNDRIHAGQTCPCATLSEIYQDLAEKRGWTEAFAKEIQNLELSVERAVIIPRAETVDLMHFAQVSGKRVMLVSDMYLPSDILSEILDNCGIRGYEALLISCEERLEKRSGLFSTLKGLTDPEDSILHIGDDPDADGRAADSAGIRSILIPSALQMAQSGKWQNALFSANNLSDRCLLGMCIAEAFRDPFQDPNLQDREKADRLRHFAVTVTGPLTAAFMTWLLKKTGIEKYDGILFLARDGYLPWQAYRELQEKFALPEAVYFKTSRHAAFLCCADREENIPWALSLRRYTGISTEKLLRYVYEIPENQIEKRGENEPEEAYIRRHFHGISASAQRARRGALRYSEMCGLKKGGIYAVVDGIAAGTVQWFMESWMPYHFQGTYLGNCSPGLRKSEHIQDYLVFENDSLLKNYIELEGFFTAPEPSVRSITPDGEVCYAEENRTPEEIDSMNQVQKMALHFTRTFFDLFYWEDEAITPSVPEELFAADGCHWVQQKAYDDWTGGQIPTKPWETGNREKA